MNKRTHWFNIIIILISQIGLLQCAEKNEVMTFWSGALQPTSARVNVKLLKPGAGVRLVVSTNPDFSTFIEGPRAILNKANPLMVALTINGLRPNTKYYYAIETGNKPDTSADDIGTFITPSDSAFSFQFTLGSCLHSNSHHPVFEKMLEKNPLFFLQMGDFHYDNPNSRSNINSHRLPYEHLLANTTYRNFFRHCPIAYVWDDHDFAGNNSDSLAAGKTNARLAYREYIPSYPFDVTNAKADAPVYQSFNIGRVHFILTDERSSRGKPTMLGTIQKQWFKNQCLYARDHHLIIAWMSTVSFGGDGPDNWGGFPAERTELSNFFRDSQIKNMFILSGDAHMVAIDDGSHHDFSTGHNNPNQYPVLQAAALNQSGSYKGGTFSTGYFPNPNDSYGQYGLVKVNDAGDSTIEISMTGFRVNSNGNENVLTKYAFKRTLK